MLSALGKVPGGAVTLAQTQLTVAIASSPAYWSEHGRIAFIVAVVFLFVSLFLIITAN